MLTAGYLWHCAVCRVTGRFHKADARTLGLHGYEKRGSVMPMIRPEDAPEAFQSAWNVHDMEALGALFDDNATFVNRFGHYVRGVGEIIALHRPVHETIYRDSTLKNELIDVVPIGDEAAIIHFWSRLTTGAAHPAGAHKIDTLILAVLTRRSDTWRFQAVENVTLTNPRTGEAVLRDEPTHG